MRPGVGGGEGEAYNLIPGGGNERKQHPVLRRDISGGGMWEMAEKVKASFGEDSSISMAVLLHIKDGSHNDPPGNYKKNTAFLS